MELQKSLAKSKYMYNILLVTGIILVAFNLRAAITSIGPLVGMIQKDIGLAYWSAGLIMSLPLIAFALMSPLVPQLASRWTNELTLIIGLCFLLIGIGIRSTSIAFLLLLGTFLIGVGIAIGNVLIPAIVRDKFPNKFGLMTSVYSTSMGLVASIASGLSIPLAIDLNLGWQGALMVWGIPALVAISIWIYLLKSSGGKQSEVKTVHSGEKQIWRSLLAWKIAAFFGFQSFLFYVTISWLPEILHARSLSIETAGWMLSFTQFIGLPASFIIPVLAARFRSQVWIAFGLGICSIGGYTGLLLGSSFPVLIVSIIFIGIAIGGTFPLALSYLGLRVKSAKEAAVLSGMVQSIGYILAAVGPAFIGYLYDIAQNWTIPLIALIIISFIVMLFGMSSGRNQYV